MDLKSFLKKYDALKLKFPSQDRTYSAAENSDYCEDVFDVKDCYWCFNGAELQGCSYNTDGYKEVDDVECDNGVRAERCFESTDFAECTDCNYIELCVRCYNLNYCYMCQDTNDCFCCANLNHKSYCIENVQYTKKEYQQKLKELKKETPTYILKRLEELKQKFPKVNSYYDDATNSDYADYVYFVKDLYYCFDSSNSQSSGFMNLSHYCQNVWDATYALNCQHSAGISYSSDCYGSYELEKCGRCYNSYYLYHCNDCHDCFGCAYLDHKQFCILNVQYTEEEYFMKLAELKNDLGLIFEDKGNTVVS
jgi:hypothetical protein